MAGGPYLPMSADPIGSSGEVFPNKHVGAGANGSSWEGLGVANATDLTADRKWHVVFRMPTTLPTGTAKFSLAVIAAIEAGDLSINPAWASVAFDEDPSAATLTSEGPDPDARTGGNGSNADNSTFGWDTADDDKILEALWTLNADTVVANEFIVMDIVIVDADTDVAAVVTLFPSIIFV